MAARVAADEPAESNVDDIMAVKPTPGNVSAFRAALDGCAGMTVALEALALAAEAMDDHVAASLVRGVRPDMADHESMTM